MFYELAQLAIGNLARARLRLLMTAGGVLVGTTAVILLIGLTNGLQQAAEAGVGSSSALTEIQVYSGGMYYGPGGGQVVSAAGGAAGQGEPPKLDVDAIKRFWQIPGVLAVIPTVNLQSGQILFDKYTNYIGIQGIDPALLSYMAIAPQQGTISLNTGEIIVGSQIPQAFFDPTAKEFRPVTLDIYGKTLRLVLQQYSSSGGAPATRKVNAKVSTILQPGTSFDYGAFMPIQEVIRLNEWITGKKYDAKKFVYDQVMIRTQSREVTNAVSDKIREMGYQTGGAGDFLKALNDFFGTMRLMLGGVGAIALLVAAFGVFNTMTMAIVERTREIGLMKAIGATDGHILTVFLVEAGLVGVTGGVSGIALSLMLQNAVNGAIKNVQPGQGISFLPVDPTKIGGNLLIMPPELLLFALGLATLVGIVAGFAPALRAANLPPVIALKSD